MPRLRGLPVHLGVQGLPRLLGDVIARLIWGVTFAGQEDGFHGQGRTSLRSNAALKGSQPFHT